jgi:hypothetical protein
MKFDRQYYPLYLNLLKGIQTSLNVKFNTNLDQNGDFEDKRVSFGYVIFVLERTRVAKLTKEIEDVAIKGFDEMYQLGQLSMLKGENK